MHKVHKRINPKSKTSISIEVFNPRWVLEQAGYVSSNRGWKRKDGNGNNRFHVFIVKSNVMEIHYDKYHDENHHSSIIKNETINEVKRLVGIANGKISNHQTKMIDNSCNRLSLNRIGDLKRYLKPRPKWIPVSIWKRIINKVVRIK